MSQTAGSDANVSCRTEFLTTSRLSVLQELQRWAVAGTFVGLGVSLPLCIMATGNVVLGVFATVNMLFILVTVVAVCPLAGLNIGVRRARSTGTTSCVRAFRALGGATVLIISP